MGWGLGCCGCGQPVQRCARSNCPNPCHFCLTLSALLFSELSAPPITYVRHKHRPHRSSPLTRHPPLHAHTRTTLAFSSLSTTYLRLRSRAFHACVVFNRAARSDSLRKRLGYSNLTAAYPKFARATKPHPTIAGLAINPVRVYWT
jgi:hypothetical protein